MEKWIAIFSIITAIALVVQVIILTAMSLQMRKTMEQMTRTVNDLHTRFGPILTRVQILLEDTQPKISNMVSDAAHVVYLARGQAQKADRIFTDAADRLRGQLIHADRILSAALEAVDAWIPELVGRFSYMRTILPCAYDIPRRVGRGRRAGCRVG